MIVYLSWIATGFDVYSPGGTGGQSCVECCVSQVEMLPFAVIAKEIDDKRDEQVVDVFKIIGYWLNSCVFLG